MENKFFPKKIRPSEAIALQKKWAPRILKRNSFKRLKFIGGGDVAFSADKRFALATMMVWTYPGLVEVDRAWAKLPLTLPYIPGLLSFREGPVLVQAYQKLKKKPDLLMVDGQGLAHPRRFGLACHLGLVLNLPTIGCAKSRLLGTHSSLAFKRGSSVALKDKGETIGRVLRTRDGVKPVYLSIGHRVDLDTACQIALKCHGGTRIPLPTREADRWVSEIKRAK